MSLWGRGRACRLLCGRGGRQRMTSIFVELSMKKICLDEGTIVDVPDVFGCWRSMMIMMMVVIAESRKQNNASMLCSSRRLLFVWRHSV